MVVIKQTQNCYVFAPLHNVGKVFNWYIDKALFKDKPKQIKVTIEAEYDDNARS